MEEQRPDTIGNFRVVEIDNYDPGNIYSWRTSVATFWNLIAPKEATEERILFLALKYRLDSIDASFRREEELRF